MESHLLSMFLCNTDAAVSDGAAWVLPKHGHFWLQNRNIAVVKMITVGIRIQSLEISERYNKGCSHLLYMLCVQAQETLQKKLCLQPDFSSWCKICRSWQNQWETDDESERAAELQDHYNIFDSAGYARNDRMLLFRGWDKRGLYNRPNIIKQMEA